MKKILLYIFLLALFITPVNVHAQNSNWVGVKSDVTSVTAVGQPIQVELYGAVDTPVTGAALILNYDPNCFKVVSHQPGNLISGATAFAQEKPGQLDLTYYFQGNKLGVAGEGAFITIQLESLAVCTSDLSVAPESILLGVLDSSGMASNLTGVTYQTLDLHFSADQESESSPSAIFSSLLSADSAPKDEALISNPTDQQINPSTGLNTPAILFFFVVLPLIASIFVLYMWNRQPRAAMVLAPKTVSSFAGGGHPALIHRGKPILLSQEHNLIGDNLEIIQQNGRSYLANKGNPEGVLLNGNRLEVGYHPLHDGDKVQVDNRITYRFIQSFKSKSS